MGQIDDDNVRGAHFCGKNTGTMGICLLGNFLFVTPTTQSLKTLEEVILWKLNKENINPADSFRHPLPGGAFLNVISGHQDGCVTDCPGTFLYNDIPTLRDSVISKIQYCSPVTAINTTVQEIDILIYPNPFLNEISINSPKEGMLIISNLWGKNLMSFTVVKGRQKLQFEDLESGHYIIGFTFQDNTKYRKLIYKAD
jgi:hypothetical protein